MRIKSINPEENGHLRILSEDGRMGIFDVRPYMNAEAFQALKNPDIFRQVQNGGYFVEWLCGADLSADTIEAHWCLETDRYDYHAVAEPPSKYGTHLRQEKPSS